MFTDVPELLHWQRLEPLELERARWCPQPSWCSDWYEGFGWRDVFFELGLRIFAHHSREIQKSILKTCFFS